MTPNRSVASSDHRHIWPDSLRNTEALPALSNPARHPVKAPYIELLRSASAFVQTGWRWLERKRTQQLSSRRLRLAETISLGEKRTVSIVQVDGAQYLIGCSTGSVQLLAVLDKKDDGANCLSDIGRAS